jgi:glycosyltransferase involved in cell wall biosynthesis
VILCTHNGAGVLSRTLDSLAAQSVVESRFEILIVDNGSTDGTAEVISTYLPRLTNARRVNEAQLGLSRARNRGVSEARGEVMAFIDDDVVLSPYWLAEVLRVMQDGHVAAVGGRIVAAWPNGRPAWLSERCEGFYGHLDLGPQQLPMRSPHHPFGGNMAIRSGVLASLGGFSVDLGRCGNSRISNEEKELFGRLHQAGKKVLYVPEASVEHVIRPAHVSRRWLCRRALAQGRSDRLTAAMAGGERAPAEARYVYAFARAIFGRRWFIMNIAHGWERALLDEGVRLCEFVGRWIVPFPIARVGSHRVR